MEKIEYTDEMRKKYAEKKLLARIKKESDTESSFRVRRHHKEEKPKAQQLYIEDIPETAEPRMEKYPRVAKKDYEIIKGEWEEMVKSVENGDPNAVIFAGTVTDEERTQTSAQIYSDLFEEKYRNRDDVVIIDRNDVEEIIANAMRSKNPLRNTLHSLRKLVESYPGKKIIFSYPYFLKELSLRPDFYETATGEPTPFHEAIREKTGDDPDLGAFCWFNEKDAISLGDKNVAVVNPEAVAQRQLKGIMNFMRLTRLIAPDRQAIRTTFGHGWNLDALATYLAKGEVNGAGFEEVLGGKIFENAKGFDVAVEKSGEIKMRCRGKEFLVPRERL